MTSISDETWALARFSSINHDTEFRRAPTRHERGLRPKSLASPNTRQWAFGANVLPAGTRHDVRGGGMSAGDT